MSDEQQRASGPLRVLVVDDNDDSRDLLELALELHGHVVVAVNAGREALERLSSEAFDVALVDIGLPDLDGYEIARLARVRLGGRTPRLVALTGYGSPDDLARARKAGFDVHLLKPIDPSRVLSVVGAGASPEP